MGDRTCLPEGCEAAGVDVGLSSTLWAGCVTQADTMRGGCRTVMGMTRAMGTFIRVRPPGGWSDS